MAINFDELIDTAQRLISENGQTLSLVRMTDASPPDSTKPWRLLGSGTEVLHACFGVSFQAAAGATVQPGDETGYVEAKSLNAASVRIKKNRDRLRFPDGIDRSIEGCQVIEPNGTPILYVLHLRALPRTRGGDT